MDTAQGNLENLKQKIQQANLPSEVSEKLDNLLKFPGQGVERERLLSYIEFVLKIPFNKNSQDILDLARAKQILDKNHFGLTLVKNRILEYLSVLILRQKNSTTEGHAPILAFVGLVGTGKTSLAYSIAESLGRQIVRIPFGGLGDTKLLRGESRANPDAQPSQIIKSLVSSGVANPVILLDEIDRVAEESRVDIMGVLVELLDPAQNHSFVDHFLDFPFDLSKVLFVTTANNTGNIATAVMDRIEPITMPSYTDQEKMTIGERFLLPKAIQEAGLDPKQIEVDSSVWSSVLRPLGFDAGIRSLNRNIEAIVRKVARAVVEGKPGPFKIDSSNIGEYIV